MLGFVNKIVFHSFPLMFCFSVIITIWSLLDLSSSNKITIELNSSSCSIQNIEHGNLELKFIDDENTSSINKKQNYIDDNKNLPSENNETQWQSFLRILNRINYITLSLAICFLLGCIWSVKCFSKLMYLTAKITEIKNAGNEYITKCFIYSILVIPIISIIDKIPRTHILEVIIVCLSFMIYIVLLLCFSQMPNIMMRAMGFHLYRVKFESGPSEYLLYSRIILNNKDDLTNIIIRPISPNEGIVDDEKLHN